MKNRNTSTHFRVIFLLILATTAVLSCRKEKDEKESKNIALQPQNSFSCLINGTPYTPKGKGWLRAYEYVQYDKKSESFSFDTYNVIDFPHLIGIGLVITGDFKATGLYQNILPAYNETVTYGDAGGVLSGNTFAIDTTFEHQIVITKFDLDNQNIAGTFKFTAIGSTKPDTLTVTNGIFDLYKVNVK